MLFLVSAVTRTLITLLTVISGLEIRHSLIFCKVIRAIVRVTIAPSTLACPRRVK